MLIHVFERFWSKCFFFCQKLRLIWVSCITIGWVVHILQEDAWNLPENLFKYAWSNWKLMEKFQKIRRLHRFCAKLNTRYNDYSIACVARTVWIKKSIVECWFVLKHLEANWFRLIGFLFPSTLHPCFEICRTRRFRTASGNPNRECIKRKSILLAGSLV